jgi:hypothetical protein
VRESFNFFRGSPCIFFGVPSGFFAPQGQGSLRPVRAVMPMPLVLPRSLLCYNKNMNKKIFSPIFIVSAVVVIALILGGAYYLQHKSALSGRSGAGKTQNSSSTAQVGDFTVVAHCTTLASASDTSVDSIDVDQASSVIQTIPMSNIYSGATGCPEIKSQDINFDGVPDFMINAGHGTTGNQGFEYWIFNTSTNQFACPAASGDCTLVGSALNFDEASDTITVVRSEGCSGQCSDTRTEEIINGVPVIVKDVRVEPLSNSPTSSLIQITAKLINGNLQVVTTTPYSAPGSTQGK